MRVYSLRSRIMAARAMRALDRKMSRPSAPWVLALAETPLPPRERP